MQCNTILLCERRTEGGVNAHCSWYHRSEQHRAGMSRVSRVAQSGGRRWQQQWRRNGGEQKGQGAPLRQPRTGSGGGLAGGREGTDGCCRRRTQQKQSRAAQRSAGVPRGPPVLSTAVCLCSPGMIGRRDHRQHGSLTVGVEWRCRDSFICVLSQNTPANHAAGAFREVCRILSRPKPLHALLARASGLSWSVASVLAAGCPPRLRVLRAAAVAFHSRIPLHRRATILWACGLWPVAAAVEHIRWRGTRSLRPNSPGHSNQSLPPGRCRYLRKPRPIVQPTSGWPSTVSQCAIANRAR
jgi:hypothetical protein